MPTQRGLIDFTAERGRHVRIIGRDDVLARLDEWLLHTDDTRWVFVTGGPGMGKSAILTAWLVRHEATATLAPGGSSGLVRRVAAWLTRRESPRPLVPHHFIRRQIAGWDQPEVIAGSLAAQLEAAFPALRDANARPESRLLDLLGRVSMQLDANRPLVVVVDGLDETSAEPDENPLPRFLPHVVPPGIRFLCATRATYPHLSWIEQRSPVRRLDLDSKQWATSNEAVVRGFWKTVAAEYQPPLPADAVDTAIARAEGNVLHAVMLHDALRDLPAGQRQADRIPRGLTALIGELWDRAASHEAVRAGLTALCAVQDALSLDVLGELVEQVGCTRWRREDAQRFVHQARQLLLEEPASWDGRDAYRLRHDWVRAVIAERVDAAVTRSYHAALARTLATWPPLAGASERRYALRYALTHRLEAGDCAGAWTLAADMNYLGARCRELGVGDTEAEVTRLATRCRASGGSTLSERADDLARALARESHWLRTAPEATAALVWNRLRRTGWSASDLDEQLRVSEDTSFLRIRHAETREAPALVRDLVGHTDLLKACTVTPNGRRVVSASNDRTLKLWDLETGDALVTLQGHTGVVAGCAVTPDGERVISASWDRTLRVWDLETGRVLAILRGHTGMVVACAVVPDGGRVVSASDDRTLRIWDLKSGRVLDTLRGHTGWVTACAVTPDGRRVISASYDKTLKVWYLEIGRAPVTLRGHTSRVTACAVTPDGRRVVSASHDRTLRVWDLETGRALATLRGHPNSVMACAVTPDGRRVVSASHDGTLKVWDLDTGSPLDSFEGHTLEVAACTVTPDGRRVVSASWDRTLKVWDLATRRGLDSFEGHTFAVEACAVTSDGRRVISMSGRTLKVWDLDTGRALAIPQGHDYRVNACAMTPDGRWVVSESNYETHKVWDVETGRALATLQGHTSGVNACAVTPDGRRVLLALNDGTLKVWDVETGCALAVLQGHAYRVNACAMMPDGQRVVSASKDGTLKVWDVETGRSLATLQDHASGVGACAVTPDGRRVVSASDDHTLKVWDPVAGHMLAILRGHTGRVSACAVTPDGRWVVSGSHDRTLKVWDLETCTCLATHRGDVPYHAVATTTTIIVAGDAMGGVWFLDMLPAVLRRQCHTTSTE